MADPSRIVRVLIRRPHNTRGGWHRRDGISSRIGATPIRPERYCRSSGHSHQQTLHGLLPPRRLHKEASGTAISTQKDQFTGAVQPRFLMFFVRLSDLSSVASRSCGVNKAGHKSTENDVNYIADRNSRLR